MMLGNVNASDYFNFFSESTGGGAQLIRPQK